MSDRPGDDARVIALGAELERSTRRVGALEGLLQQLAGDVATLAHRVGGGGPGDGDAVARPLAWLQVDDPDVARATLGDLIEWLDAVYLRYPAATLSACWMWHPAAIEELWWLRNAHADAYAGRAASWQRVADWHDRQRPGVVKRLDHALGSCELSLHQPGKDQTVRVQVSPMAAYADQVAAAWTSTGLPPEPTELQVIEAKASDQSQRISSREAAS